MVFTSLIFLFVFFPIFMIGYLCSLWLAKKKLFFLSRLPDLCLILLSLFFVAWNSLKGACAFLYLIVIVYILGKILARCKHRRKTTGKVIVFIGILFMIGGLYYFKYATYISELFDEYLGISVIGSPTWTFLGISFVSFSAVSYIIDIYRGGNVEAYLMLRSIYLSFRK